MSTKRSRMIALRGATSCEEDTPRAIFEATQELLKELMDRNGVTPDDLVSIIFTSTPDLVSDFPATAARKIGLSHVPLLCAAEIAVPGGLPRCIRILAHLESTLERPDRRHVYLHRATVLRADLENPDLSNPQALPQ